MPLDPTPWINLGGMGLVLYFVLTRLIPTIDQMEQRITEKIEGMTGAIHENTRANLLVAIASAGANDEVRRLAKTELDRHDASLRTETPAPARGRAG